MSITVRYGSRLAEVSPGMFTLLDDASPADPGLYVMGTYFGPDPQVRTLVGFSWGGISFTQWGPYYLTKVEGWDSPPDGKADDRPVAGGHGSARGRVTRGARTVTIEGFCLGADRDALFNQLADAMAAGFGDGDDTSPLVGDVAGRNLTSDAYLMRFAPTVEQVKWGRRYFGWAVQFRCPDPFRYGLPITVSAPIVVPTSGLTPPVTPPVVMPANPIGGQVLVPNQGNASAPVLITLSGGAISGPGVLLVDTSARLEFDFDLAASDVLTIDTAEGVCRLNGEYRSPSAISSLTGELAVPRNSTATFQALGDPVSGTPGISVWTVPTYW